MALTFEQVAAKTWGIDVIDLTSDSHLGVAGWSEQASVPGWYKDLLRGFLEVHPDDTAFIVSTGDGDGFGSILCVEESCYQDVILSRGPDLLDGGRGRGFGSFDAFAEHCTELEHAAARDERVKRSGCLSKAGDRNASPGPSRQAVPKTSAYRLPAPTTAAGDSQVKAYPPSRAIPKAAPLSPPFSPDQLSFGSGSKSGGKPGVKIKPFAPSSSPEPLSIRLPIAHRNGKQPASLPKGPAASRVNERPVELIELSDSSDDDFSRRKAMTLDRFLGLDKKKARVGSSVECTAPRKKFRPELTVSKDKTRASSPEPLPLPRSSSRMSSQEDANRRFAAEEDAWAMREAASEMGREKVHEVHDRERFEAADRARATCAAPAGHVNAVAGPSNAGATGSTAAVVPALAAPVDDVAPAPFVPGHASSAELAVMREERDCITKLSTLYGSIHPAWKQVNAGWAVRFAELSDRLRKLHTSASMAMRIQPIDPHLAVIPPTNAAPPGSIPASSQQVIQAYVPVIGQQLQRLANYSMRLRGLSALTTASNAAAAARAGGLGYNGALGGDGAFANIYDPAFHTLAGPRGYPYGYLAEEVGDNGFRAPGDLKDFFDIAAADFGESEVVAEAARKLGLKDHSKDKMPGLAITLMPHQIQGVAWMLAKEQDAKCKGGIMADDMGLGKTVQALGVMVANRAEADDRERTTLIVCPFALIDQWRLEIETKCTPNLMKIHVQHGKDKVNKVTKLQRFDVIITTYATLVQDFPDYRKHDAARKKAKKARKDRGDPSDSEDSAEERANLKKGPLAQLSYHRVILDEAQQIRNRNTRAAQACFGLEAEYRWALTGTPVTNGLEDLWSLLRFVGVRPWNDWSEYNAHVVKKVKRNPGLAASRAQAILKFCLIRRNKDSKIDGVPILTLKPKHIKEDLLEFSPDERTIYTALEQRARAKFNRFLKKGTVMRNYTQVLTLLLRLRQAANHPILLVRNKDEVRPDDILIDDKDDYAAGAAGGGVVLDDAAELDRATRANGAAWISKQKKALFDRAFKAAVAELEGEEIDDEAWACAICFEDSRISEEVITACGHRFCRTCLTDVLQQVQQIVGDNDAEQANKRPCPSCRSPFDIGTIFATAPLEPTEAEVDAELKKQGKVVAAKAKAEADDDVNTSDDGADATGAFGREDEDIKPFINKKKSGGGVVKGSSFTAVKGKGKGRMLDSDDEDFVPSDEIVPWWKEDRIMMDPRHRQHRKKLFETLGLEEDEEIEPSTKMKALLALLKTSLAESPDDKVVVYSQWTTMLDLVADYLRIEKVSYDIYDGRMNRAQRDETIRAFNSRKNPQVLLLSLKAGGVGLNLVRANRVINLDLAWNAATETQARDRVHRLGQQKEVFVNRLIVADTVEQRILALQERKQKESDAALGEGTGAKLKRMTVQDLQALFG